eukprot:scaffold106574_cov19-Tisochrysis_lutea.AAC.1
MLGYRGKGIRLSTPFSQTKGHRELLSRFATKVLVRNGVAAPVQRKWEPVVSDSDVLFWLVEP